jgi:hypothetical protein
MPQYYFTAYLEARIQNQVFEDRVLRRIFGPKRGQVTRVEVA